MSRMKAKGAKSTSKSNTNVKTVTVLAFRHVGDQQEAIFGEMVIPPKITKFTTEQLVTALAGSIWANQFEKVARLISQYIHRTEVFKLWQMLNDDSTGIVLNFYEKDLDTGFTSSRESSLVSKTILKERWKQFVADNKSTHRFQEESCAT